MCHGPFLNTATTGYILRLFLLMNIPAALFGSPGSDSLASRTTITALRVVNPVTIDGRLLETDWQRPGYTRFTQREPVESAPPTEKTEVWFAYDDEALYVAARCYDSQPDSIVTRIGRRDAEVSSDWFYVGIDSYHDRRSGFYFAVNPGGSVIDGTFYNDESTDNSWDGVWEAATWIDGGGWSLEMKIPYSQLRFPNEESYTWGVACYRHIERKKEEDWFPMVPKKESGFVSRFPDLTGIRDIHPPSRVEILPYTVTSTKLTNQFSPGDPFHRDVKFSGNMGADLKVGLGSNLTLTAAINPDFGQVEVDPAVVNLTQFETFYEEKRPFFVEGSDFFSFGNGGSNNNWNFNFSSPNFFYSRRIGRPPEGSVRHGGFVDMPDRTAILGAAKISGKISDGWSIGSLHAVTPRETADIDSSGVRFADIVEPLTSYNVVRTQYQFNKGHQAVGIIGSAVLRDLSEPYLTGEFNTRAYIFGADGWTNLDSAQTYVVTSWLATSRAEGSRERITSLQQAPLHYYQRPDAPYVRLDTAATSLSGYAGRVAINKQKGNFYLNAAFGFVTPGFEPNDMGFIFRTDLLNAHIVLGYQWFTPDGFFRQKSLYLATSKAFDFAGRKINDGYFLFYNFTLMSYWQAQTTFNFNREKIDDNGTRGGPALLTLNNYNLQLQLNSDSRQPFVLQAQAQLLRVESGSHQVDVSPGIVWKPSSRVTVSFAPEINNYFTMGQWVVNVADPAARATYGGRYIFGELDQREVSANIRLDWTFTPTLTLQLYLQPLISVGAFRNFKELRQPGTFTFNVYGKDNGSTITRDAGGDYEVDPDGPGPGAPFTITNPDFNYKSLRGNVVLRWEYLPGSTLYLVWTQSRTNYDNAGDFSFGRDLGRLIGSADHENVFLLKLAYWWNP